MELFVVIEIISAGAALFTVMAYMDLYKRHMKTIDECAKREVDSIALEKLRKRYNELVHEAEYKNDTIIEKTKNINSLFNKNKKLYNTNQSLKLQLEYSKDPCWVVETGDDYDDFYRIRKGFIQKRDSYDGYVVRYSLDDDDSVVVNKKYVFYNYPTNKNIASAISDFIEDKDFSITKDSYKIEHVKNVYGIK